MSRQFVPMILSWTKHPESISGIYILRVGYGPCTVHIPFSTKGEGESLVVGSNIQWAIGTTYIEL